MSKKTKIKQILSTAVLLMSMAMSITATNISIGGNGITVHTALPLSPTYDYSYSQTIYFQSEINFAGMITDIKYHYNRNSAWTDSIDIYMGTTTRSDFETDHTWFDASRDISEVFSGKLEVNTSRRNKLS